jgi:effector-binding domain-containing protein
MIDEPHIATLPERPYVAIAATVGVDDLATVVPPLNGEVFGWLAARGIAPAGPPLWRYNVIDMARGLEVEAGVTVAAAVAGDGRVIAGVLPAGRYVIMRHVGHPDELMAATGSLLDWAAEKGLTWDVAVAGRRPVGRPAGDLPLRPGCRAGHDQVGDRAGVPAG